MQGTIFNVQRFCVHDGPGIRTTVFFKGCPLRCRWCHNPESQLSPAQMLCRIDLCTRCGACAKACEKGCHQVEGAAHTFDFSACVSCGKCAQVCPAGALEKVGRRVTPEEVLKEVLKDKIFYEQSGGGMTVSGGEPFLQAEFLIELLRLAKEAGIHTAIETCGFTSEETLVRAADYTDLFLFDYKVANEELHRQYTGVSPERILANLAKLEQLGSAVILRCPIIPGCNDTEEHFRGIAETANRFFNIRKVELEPYHNLGESKREGLGWETNSYPVPEDNQVETWRRQIAAQCRCEVARNQ